MKGIYIFSTNNKDYKSDGEAKKVFSQINAFRERGVNISFFDAVLGRKIDKVLYRLPFFGVYPKGLIRKCKQEVVDSDFVYVRKNIFDCSFYRLLKEIKKMNPSIITIVEIPTYPYFQEWNRFVDKAFIIKERIIIPKIKRDHLVDYYMTLTDDKEIFGLPTIIFNNCISVDDYLPKKNKQNPNEIHLIGVALLAKWHGYDRILSGMKEYYSQKKDTDPNVVFHIVGDGPEYDNLKRITLRNNLQSYVFFEGKRSGAELDSLYDISNIGIGPLGLFRKGLSSATSLKLREYCAKGIPFIKGGNDLVFDNYQYCFNVSNDETPIDIFKLVSWAKKIDYESATIKMREYALTNLNWDHFVDDVLNRINEVHAL